MTSWGTKPQRNLLENFKGGDIFPNDVLFGRGKPFQVHPGNVRLHQLVDERKHVYTMSRRDDKTMIATSIVDLIKREGGRFLRQYKNDKKKWMEVDDLVARNKVSHALRGTGRELPSSKRIQAEVLTMKRVKKQTEKIHSSDSFTTRVVDFNAKRMGTTTQLLNGGTSTLRYPPTTQIDNLAAAAAVPSYLGATALDRMPAMNIPAGPIPSLAPSYRYHQALLLNQMAAERERLLLQELTGTSRQRLLMQQQPQTSSFQDPPNNSLLETLRSLQNKSTTNRFK